LRTPAAMATVPATAASVVRRVINFIVAVSLS
jgi:hypothetical protein